MLLNRLLVDNGVIAGLAEHLAYAPDRLPIITEAAWVTTYLAARYEAISA
jgi:hypothetical protein